MTQRKITVADIMSTKPCYSHKQVAELFGDLEYATIEQILACDITIADRVWVGVRLLTDLDHVVEFAKKCAERAKEYAANYAYDSAAAVYANSAVAAAHNSAHNSADSAAYGVAAADSALCAAATVYADYVPYGVAAATNNYGIERDLQIDHLNELHKREEKG